MVLKSQAKKEPPRCFSIRRTRGRGRVMLHLERVVGVEPTFSCLEGKGTTFIPHSHYLVPLHGIEPRTPDYKTGAEPFGFKGVILFSGDVKKSV